MFLDVLGCFQMFLDVLRLIKTDYLNCTMTNSTDADDDGHEWSILITLYELL